MRKFLILLLLLPFMTIAQDKVKFVAAGVTCSMCSNAIHKSLKLDTSLKQVNPNLQTQEWNLVYPPGEFKLENLKKRVEDAGFSISKVWLNGQLIYEHKKKRK